MLGVQGRWCPPSPHLRGTRGLRTVWGLCGAKISSDTGVSTSQSQYIILLYSQAALAQTVLMLQAGSSLELPSWTKLEKWAEGFCGAAVRCPELVSEQVLLNK